MPSIAATPADVIAALERGTPVPSGPGDRYAGYGILGVQFASGDLLALRRFPVASSGVGYTAVWHRRADGAWTFHTDATSGQGCTSHFAPALERIAISPIRLEWESPWQLSIAVDGGREIAWTVTFAAPWRTRLVTSVAALVPETWWTHPAALRAIAFAVRATLGTGPLRLTGQLPSGARYFSNPRKVWQVAGSRASIRGADLGAIARVPAAIALGDFVIPRRPLLASGPLFVVPPSGDATTEAPTRDARDRDRARRAG